MVKAPSKVVSPTNIQLQQQPYHQQLYQVSPLFVKVQHLEMGNEKRENQNCENDRPFAQRFHNVPTEGASTSAGQINEDSQQRPPSGEFFVRKYPRAVKATPLSGSQVLNPPHILVGHASKDGVPTTSRMTASAPVPPIQYAPIHIVEPVFHFGGFEHIDISGGSARLYCPTHSQGHEHVVFFHINSGVSVTFQIGGNREVIRGEFYHFIIILKNIKENRKM